VSAETADRFRRAAARWIHRNRPGNNGADVDCSTCYEDAAGFLATMDTAMGGTGSEDLAALVADLKQLPARCQP
jgi:hypothetical protein